MKKLGLRPFSPRKSDLQLAHYRTDAPLPPHPAQFGHETLIDPKGWGMLANDKYGCCFFAGMAHQFMLAAAINKRSVRFTEETVLADYAACTGFDISKTDDQGNNPTDQGTELQTGLDYCVNTGIVDDQGNRHKLGLYAFLESGNWDQNLESIYFADFNGLGLTLPASAEHQFDQGKPWTVVTRSPDVGGHYVCGVGQRKLGQLVTWGALQAYTQQFFLHKCDTPVVMITEETLNDPGSTGKSAEGYDWASLQAYAKAVRSLDP